MKELTEIQIELINLIKELNEEEIYRLFNLLSGIEQ